MKTIVWAALQSMSTLEVIDRMLPDIIDESELERSPGRFKYRRGLKKAGRAYDRSTTVATGLALVTVGILMLIPGPVDVAFALAGATIGGILGGPGGAAMGALIGIVIYNAIAIAVVVTGIVLIVAGLLGA